MKQVISELMVIAREPLTVGNRSNLVGKISLGGMLLPAIAGIAMTLI